MFTCSKRGDPSGDEYEFYVDNSSPTETIPNIKKTISLLWFGARQKPGQTTHSSLRIYELFV